MLDSRDVMSDVTAAAALGPEPVVGSGCASLPFHGGGIRGRAKAMAAAFPAARCHLSRARKVGFPRRLVREGRVLFPTCWVEAAK